MSVCGGTNLTKGDEQLVCVLKMSVFGPQSSIECITVMAKLVAALHDESHGKVVIGRQLVSMEDDDLSPGHHLLMKKTDGFSTGI